MDSIHRGKKDGKYPLTYKREIRWQNFTDKCEHVRRFFSPREESHFEVKISSLHRDFFRSRLDHVYAHVFNMSNLVAEKC